MYRKPRYTDNELAEIRAENRAENGDPELRELIGEEEFMKWRDHGDEINLKAKDHQWELGQWIVEGEMMKEAAGITVDQSFKHSVYAAAASITGYSIHSIKGFASVVRNVPEEIKNEYPTLSFGHFKAVAKYNQDHDKQRARLTEMAIGDLTVTRARDRMLVLDGEIKVRKSKADRRATTLIAHLNHVLRELEDNNDLDKASPKLQEMVDRKVLETMRALKHLTPQGVVAA
jgi:hypothetical protein